MKWTLPCCQDPPAPRLAIGKHRPGLATLTRVPGWEAQAVGPGEIAGGPNRAIPEISPPVLRDLSRRLRPLLDVQPRYELTELPELLTGVSVGVVPSRVEGFGYGVLERLAAAVPVITYDAPGPHVMLPRTSACRSGTLPRWRWGRGAGGSRPPRSSISK
jgi:hypothetical protein